MKYKNTSFLFNRLPVSSIISKRIPILFDEKTRQHVSNNILESHLMYRRIVYPEFLYVLIEDNKIIDAVVSDTDIPGYIKIEDNGYIYSIISDFVGDNW